MSSPRILLCLCMTFTLALVSGQDDTWSTDFRQPFSLVCPHNYIAVSIESYHDNGQEDRRWRIQCNAPLAHANATNCAWTENYINDFDLPMFFTCPKNQAIAGLQGDYNVGAQDRRFKVYCCDIYSISPFFKTYTNQKHLQGCTVTDFTNDFDQPLSIEVSGNEAINGIFSYHSNPHEDRRYRFQTCDIV